MDQLDWCTDVEWEAILHNDAAFDHQFFYAVRTTNIFCRPSCKSKPPRRENVRIFKRADEALAEQYRPCKRCKPTGERLPDQEWVSQIIAYIDSNYNQQLTLAELADVCHGSPFHLQRTFKRLTGMTPALYIQQKRIEAASRQLAGTSRSVAQIAQDVGIPNTPYFMTLFKKITGHTPGEYRRLYGKAGQQEV